MILTTFFTLLLAKQMLLWVAIAIIAFAVHFFTKDYISLSAAIGAGITVVAFMMGYNGLLTQVLVFAITTFIFCASFLPLMIQKSNAKRMKSQIPSFALRDRHALVTETVDNMNAQGMVEIDGQQHKARAADGNIKTKGDTVLVLDHDKDILLVR